MDYRVDVETGLAVYYITDRAHVLEVYWDPDMGPDYYSYNLYNKLGDLILEGDASYLGENIFESGMVSDLGEDLIDRLGEYSSIELCILENNVPNRSWYIEPRDDDTWGDWTGAVVIKPQNISSEDYNKYFDTERISDLAIRYIMEQGKGVHICNLKDTYRDQIINAILEGKTESTNHDDNLPMWEVRICCILNDKEVSFFDLSEELRKEILEDISIGENQGSFWEEPEIEKAKDTLDELISEATIEKTIPCGYSDKQRDDDAR